MLRRWGTGASLKPTAAGAGRKRISMEPAEVAHGLRRMDYRLLESTHGRIVEAEAKRVLLRLRQAAPAADGLRIEAAVCRISGRCRKTKSPRHRGMNSRHRGHCCSSKLAGIQSFQICLVCSGLIDPFRSFCSAQNPLICPDRSRQL